MKVFDLHVHVDTPSSVKYLGKQFNLVISLLLFFLCRTLEKMWAISDMQNLSQVDGI